MVPPRVEPRLVKTVPEIGVILNKLTLFSMERKAMFSLSNMKYAGAITSLVAELTVFAMAPQPPVVSLNLARLQEPSGSRDPRSDSFRPGWRHLSHYRMAPVGTGTAPECGPHCHSSGETRLFFRVPHHLPPTDRAPSQYRAVHRAVAAGPDSLRRRRRALDHLHSGACRAP